MRPRLAATAQHLGRRGVDRLRDMVGGPARLRVVGILAAVLALNSADTGTIGALAAQLERDLHISHAQLGLLSSVSAGVGAAACLPVGVLADRVNRVRLLTITVVGWSAAMVASGLATSYLWLLVSRFALGAAVAASGPVIASLIGDLFTPTDRARAYGWILSGEILGAGAGLLIGGDIAAALSWRYSFFLLALASLGLAFLLWRKLPEPARGGASRIPAGAQRIPLPGNDQAAANDDDHHTDQPSSGGNVKDAIISGTAPAEDRVQPATSLPLWHAFRYLLSIPTIRLLIIASSIGYFFFAGLRTFAIVFVERWYRLPQTQVSGLVLIIGLGALAGVLLGGRLTDRALARGASTARVTAPAIGYTAAALLFVPGLLTHTVAISLPLFTAAAAALSSANPPLDAARLDIVPAGLWGRAESLRTVLRLAAEALAPAVFGFAADQVGHGRSGTGLRDAFLIMLLPLLANGVIVWGARKGYPVDVATATASDRRAAQRSAT